jgi:hypothetical protein
VVTQQGEVFATENLGCQDYDGLDRRPPPEAALSAVGARDRTNLDGQLLAGGWAADGFSWIPAGN